MKVKEILNLLGELTILLGVIVSLMMVGNLTLNHARANESVASKIIEEITEIEELIEIETNGLKSRYALLVDLQNGRTILNQGGSETMYPASMTKVMTALVAIEALDDLNDLIQLNPEMFSELHAQEAALAGFSPGEEVPAIDLLYGIMLPSGAESAIGLAEAVAGSEENFVQLMNMKASELGMEGTNFTNSVGFHDANHYSTAEDMVKLVQYALRNETFKELFMAETHRAANGILLESTLFSRIPTTIVEGGEIIGGKTGFTIPAGRCLVSLAEINGKQYILVTAAAENTPENQIQHLLDALYIYNQL